MARHEEVQAQDALAGERGGYGDSHGTEHKATAHVLGQGTAEVGADGGPAASGAVLFGEQPTFAEQPSSEIHTAPREFFNSGPWPLPRLPETMKIEPSPRLFSHQAGLFSEVRIQHRTQLALGSHLRLATSAADGPPPEPADHIRSEPISRNE